MEEEDRREEERAKRLKSHTSYVKRVIAHDNFRNVSFKVRGPTRLSHLSREE